MLILHDLAFRDLLNAGRNHLGEIAYVGDQIQEIPQELNPFLDFIYQSQSNVENAIVLSSVKPLKKGTKPALFLDRDGIINSDHGYVGTPEQVDLLPGIAQLINLANHKKYDVNIVTNQSGIGRGLYSEADYKSVMTCITNLLSEEQAHMDHIEFAPHHPNAENPIYLEGRHFRKPRAGMILKLQNLYQYDLQSSILIGDKASDIMAGMVAGIGQVYLFESEELGQEWNKLKNWFMALRKYGLSNEFNHIQVKQLTDFSEVKL